MGAQAPGAAARRVVATARRNAILARRDRGRMLLTGAVEPLLYLLSIGYGVGALVGELALPDGTRVPYAAFVAPGALAASAMTGALTETVYNFFGRMRYGRLYDALMCTPLRPVELALGELGWALLRGGLYAAVFLAAMVALGLTSGARALLAWPVTLLVALVFGAVGMLVATTLRGWQDFDLTLTGQLALFLFSATFVPPHTLPPVLRWLTEVSPLTHAVVLLRGILVGGASGARLAVSAALLAGLAAVCLAAASRRLARRLYR